MKKLLAPLLLLLLASCTTTKPRQSWRGFSGPAYLPAATPTTRRPSQHVLDSLAGAARRRKALLLAK